MRDDLLFEIRDAAVNDEALREEIARRTTARGMTLPAYPTFGHLAAAHEGLDDGQLSYNLQEAASRFAASDLELDLKPSPATQLPIVGSLWNGVRRHLHEVVLFYVHKLAGHTATVDHHLVGALNELARQAAVQEEELVALRERIAALEEAVGDAAREES